MLFTLFLYILAVALLIYIVLHYARNGKINVSDAIAALAIVVSIILAGIEASSPPSDPAPPTETLPIQVPEGKLVFDEDFEERDTSSFYPEMGKWTIVDDGTGNKVMEAGNYREWSSARFGPPYFSDGTIEYRTKYVEYNSSRYSGLAYLNFRDSLQSRYIFALDPEWLNAHFDYQEEGAPSWVMLDMGMAAFEYQKNRWYSVRVTISGPRMKAYLDQKLVIDTRDSRLKTGHLKFGTAAFNTVVQFDDIRVWALE